MKAVESDPWCTDSTALWTNEDLGWGQSAGCSLSLPPASFLCGLIALCLKWAPTVVVWGLLLPWLMVDSHLCKLSLQLFPSWSLMKTAWGMHVFHPCDMDSPAQLHLKQDGLYAGQAGFLEDYFIWHIILPFDATSLCIKNQTLQPPSQAALVKLLKWSDLLLAENQGLCTIQEGGNDDNPVYLDLCGEVEWMTLPCSLW